MSNAFLGAGDVWLDRLTEAGVSQGMVKVGIGMLDIKSNVTLTEQTSKGRDDYGQVTASVAINKPADLSLALTEVDRKGLAIAFMGIDADYTLTAGTVSSVTPEAVTAHMNLAVRLAHRNVSAVVVKDHTDVTTYILGTDYTLDTRLGMITAIGSTIKEGDVLHVSYSYAAESGYRIQGAVQPTVRMAIYFDGKNLVDGTPCYVTVYDAQVTPESSIDFLSDKFAEIKLKGRMVTPVGKSEPFLVEMLTA